MAGDWIKMRNDLADDPAVIAIAARVGLDEFAIVGRLHTLWAWADEQSRDGHAVGVTSAWLDRKVQCDGFAAALVGARWLEVGEAGLSIPNFDNHNGATAKVRALGTRRKQRERAGGAPDPEAPDVTGSSAAGHAPSVTKARPEKRREESQEKPPSGVQGEGKAKASKRCPDTFGVDAAMVAWAKENAPGVDIPRETVKFRNHTFGTARQDWPATWRNWILEAADRKQQRGVAVDNGYGFETPTDRAKRERIAELTGGLASRKPTGPAGPTGPTLETLDVPARLIG